MERKIIIRNIVSDIMPADTLIVVKVYAYIIGDRKEYRELFSREMTYSEFIELQKPDTDISKYITFEDNNLTISNDVYLEVYPKCQLSGTKYIISDTEYTLEGHFHFSHKGLIEEPAVDLNTNGSNTNIVVKGCTSLECRDAQSSNVQVDMSASLEGVYEFSGKQYRDLPNRLFFYIDNTEVCKITSMNGFSITFKEIKDLTGIDLLSDYSNKNFQIRIKGDDSKVSSHNVSCINVASGTPSVLYGLNFDGRPVDSSRFKTVTDVGLRTHKLEYSTCYSCTVESDLEHSVLKLITTVSNNEHYTVEQVNEKGIKVYMLDTSNELIKKPLATITNGSVYLTFKQIKDITGFDLLDINDKRYRFDFYFEESKQMSLFLETKRKNIEINFDLSVEEFKDRNYHNIIGELSHNLYTECEDTINEKEFVYNQDIKLVKSLTGDDNTWVDASNAVDNFEFKLPARLDSNKVVAFTFDIDYTKIDMPYYAIVYNITINNACMISKFVRGIKKFFNSEKITSKKKNNDELPVEKDIHKNSKKDGVEQRHAGAPGKDSSGSDINDRVEKKNYNSGGGRTKVEDDSSSLGRLDKDPLGINNERVIP